MQQLDRIGICSTCKNRAFNRTKGLVCGLSMEIPVFETSCPDFSAEEKVRHIHVPGSTALSLEQAGTIPQQIRMIHLFIDLACLAFLIFLTWLLADRMNWFVLFEINRYVFYSFAFLTYYTFFEYVFLQTPGKMFSRTKVLNTHHERPKFLQVFARSLLRLIPFEGLSFLNPEAIGWHDKYSETKLVSAHFKNRKSKADIIDDQIQYEH